MKKWKVVVKRVTLKELNELLETTELPVAYREWPDEKRRLLPLFVIWWSIATTSVRTIRFSYPINHIKKSSYIQN